MRLHFPSVAIGVAAVSMILVSMSLATATPAGPPRIEYGPSPRDMVQIREGAPYVVPAGKIFALTALGRYTEGSCYLFVDGQFEVTGNLPIPGGNGATVTPCSLGAVPPGFTVAAGSTISLSGGGGFGRAWGYLANQ